jgi:hypothetical protein
MLSLIQYMLNGEPRQPLEDPPHLDCHVGSISCGGPCVASGITSGSTWAGLFGMRGTGGCPEPSKMSRFSGMIGHKHRFTNGSRLI